MAQICSVAPPLQISWLLDWISSLTISEQVRLVPLVCCSSEGLIELLWPSGIMSFVKFWFGCGVLWQVFFVLVAAHVLCIGGSWCTLCRWQPVCSMLLLLLLCKALQHDEEMCEVWRGDK